VKELLEESDSNIIDSVGVSGSRRPLLLIMNVPSLTRGQGEAGCRYHQGPSLDPRDLPGLRDLRALIDADPKLDA